MNNEDIVTWDVATKYAEFAIECDRRDLPILDIEGWLKL